MAYQYRVTQARFFGGILYEPGKREVITTAKKFPEKTKGVVLLDAKVAEKAVKRQNEKDAKKKQQVEESNQALAAAKGLGVKAEPKSSVVETLQ